MKRDFFRFLSFAACVQSVALCAQANLGVWPPRQFVLANPDDFQSDLGTCIVPVSDPDTVGQVQSVIAAFRVGGTAAVDELGKGDDFLVWIALGADQVNRDFGRMGAPSWNWHVTEVVGFFGAGPEDYYASPKSLESDASIPEYSGGHFVDGVALARFYSTLPVGEFPFPFDPAEGLEWKRSWVGLFYDAEYPWFYHGDFGWFFANGLDPENLWAWAHGKRAWILLRESIFPWFYDTEAGSWRYYLGGEDDQTAWYYTAATETWSSEF